MTRKKLKIILLQKNITLSHLALDINVAPTCVYDTIAGRMTSRKIEGALEEVFEMPIEKIRSAWMTYSDNPTIEEIQDFL